MIGIEITREIETSSVDLVFQHPVTRDLNRIESQYPCLRQETKTVPGTEGTNMINPCRQLTPTGNEQAAPIEIEGIVPMAPEARPWSPCEAIMGIPAILAPGNRWLSHWNPEGLRNRLRRLKVAQDPEIQDTEDHDLVMSGDETFMVTRIAQRTLRLSHRNDEGLQNRLCHPETAQDPEIQGTENPILMMRENEMLVTTRIVFKMLQHKPKDTRQVQPGSGNKIQRHAFQTPPQCPHLGQVNHRVDQVLLMAGLDDRRRRRVHGANHQSFPGVPPCRWTSL